MAGLESDMGLDELKSEYERLSQLYLDALKRQSEENDPFYNPPDRRIRQNDQTAAAQDRWMNARARLKAKLEELGETYDWPRIR